MHACHGLTSTFAGQVMPNEAYFANRPAESEDAMPCPMYTRDDSMKQDAGLC